MQIKYIYGYIYLGYGILRVWIGGIGRGEYKDDWK